MSQSSFRGVVPGGAIGRTALVLLLAATGRPLTAHSQTVASACDPWHPAPDPVVLWGVERDCLPDATAARDVLTELDITYHRAARQVAPEYAASVACVGAACLQALTAQPSCRPALRQGSLLGVRIAEVGTPSAPLLRMHIWRHDSDSGQTWEYELAPRSCQDGVCGDGRYADQDLRRLRPGQRVAIALGRLLQGKIDADFRSCQSGCGPALPTPTGLPNGGCALPALPACPARSARLGDTWSPPTSASSEAPRSAPVARTALAIGLGVSGATLVGLGAVSASSLGQIDACTDAGPMAKSCLPLGDVYQSGLWIAGASTTLFALGLGATVLYDKLHKPPAAGPARATQQSTSPSPTCPWLLP